MKYKLSLRQKIVITFFILFSIVILVSILGFLNYNRLNTTIHILEKKESLLNNILESRRYEKNFFITKDISNLKIAIEFLNKGKIQINELLKEENSDFLKKELVLIENYEKEIKNFITKYNSSLSLENINMTSIQEKGRLATIELEKAINEKRSEIKKIIQSSRIFLLISISSFVLLAIITFLFLVKNVNKPLKNIEKAIQKIVSGDYESIPKIKTGDEFENLAENINNLLKEMRLRNRQLLQKEKMAALGTLTSGVAHEINNPLNNISTSLQIILEELEGGDIKLHQELLEEALRQVDRAKDIVKSLLEFSRESSFNPKEVNFKTLIQKTLKLIQGEIPTHLQIEIKVPENLIVKLDSRRIQQVLLNLILNAIQAIDNNPGKIIIGAETVNNDQDLRFYIEDTGPGIPKENLSKIFDPFFTTKDVGAGSGLGLAVSQGIIEQHGGKIEVESELNKGTKFTITIPKAIIV
ncbi:MAG: two-component system, NtrC family, sensor kinase [Desulfonauticus sp.]|jgi:signal transduction histidine kinase|nr:MAG: Integral membrane sensor signal transduction histidine kinase [Desulfonauticus sp. 38_4375]MDK2922490.1 two-component system, NtrC family, sensor kinase [Desulfonauticus sp.]